MFVVIFLIVFGALHFYVWRRLVRDTTRPGSALRRAGTCVMVAGPLLTAGAQTAGAIAPFTVRQLMAWPGYLWLVLFLYLLLALLAGEVVRPILLRRLARRDGARAAETAEPATLQNEELAVGEPQSMAVTASGGSTPHEPTGPVALAERPHTPEPEARPRPERAGPSRRLFVSRVVGGTAAAVALGTVGYGTHSMLSGPKVKRLTVPLANLPRAAHGYRIAVVSDMHLGPVLGRGFAQHVVDTINRTQPDLIAVVGDLVDGNVADLGNAVEPLAQLRSRHGSYFVTGNHEYFVGAEQWVDKVRDLGLHPLENTRTELPGFDLAGVNDVTGADQGQGPDFAKALGDRDRSRASVLLAHQPIVIDDAVRHGVGLQLSGHTHGGQLWPVNYVAELANPTVEGLERYGDTQLYVSRGAGAWGPPVRVGAPSDITIVELASKQA
ncbi:metallophosphoesterase [Streptomyces ochraceiscleroticus]|uniref:Metallophosphoesterase n=1 Tax=Streptomyces ochraceiscleroticus TaxID=47761 RepID=A0ABW1MQ76_9ACTN|nr:metallophosphoesterase [Streptomyces ochraceiscleroticus]